MGLASQFFSMFMTLCLMLTIKTKRRKTEHIEQEEDVGVIEYESEVKKS